MGLQHSTPVPTDSDFLVKHRPPVNSLSSRMMYPVMEWCFRIHRNAWKAGASFNGLGVKLMPVDNNQCLVQDDAGTVLVVLQVKRHREIQICTFTPTGKIKTSVGEYDGKPLYEYALVMERQDRDCYILMVNGTRYQTKRCGSKFGPNNLVILRGDAVCAHLTKEPEKMRGCRVAPGVDLVLMVAFVACSDKMKVMFDDLILRKSKSQTTQTNWRLMA